MKSAHKLLPIFFLLAVLISLPACQGQEAAQPAVIDTAVGATVTEMPSPAPATATSTEIASTTPSPTTTPTPTTVPTPAPTPLPSPTPNTALANGLILLLPNGTHHVIIKNGQVERLAYEDTLLLGANAPLLGMAVGPDGQLFSLSENFFVTPRRVTIAVQQGDEGKETFFDNEQYEATRIYGVVGKWLIASLVSRELLPSQAAGDLAAIAPVPSDRR